MYYTGKNLLGKIGYKSEDVVVPKGDKTARCTKRCCVTTIRELAADPSGAGTRTWRARVGERNARGASSEPTTGVDCTPIVRQRSGTEEARETRACQVLSAYCGGRTGQYPPVNQTYGQIGAARHQPAC